MTVANFEKYTIDKAQQKKLCNSSQIIRVNGANVSETFMSEVARALAHESIDAEIRKVIEETQGLKVGVAENFHQVFSEKKKEWGYSYMNYEDNTAWLYLFENKNSRLKFDLSAIVRHELGHHADFMFNKISGCDYTDMQSFSKVYAKDKKVLKKHKIDMLKEFCPDWEKALCIADYYVAGKGYRNPSLAGKWETFAEVFAMLMGGSGGESRCYGMDRFYKEAFPNVIADVKEMLNNLKRR